MSEADAEKALQVKNLVVKKGDPVYSDDVEQGEVVSVSPSEGAEVKEGTTVTLVISKGNQPATVPKLTGKSQSDAEAALSQAGLSGNATEDYSDTVEEGVYYLTGYRCRKRSIQGHNDWICGEQRTKDDGGYCAGSVL